jgi:hypothetical protein
MVIPFERIDLFALMAILGSTIASCWVDSYEAKLAIDSELLGAFPIPEEGPVWNELAAVGRELYGSRGDSRVIARSEDLVRDSYRLPNSIRTSIDSHIRGFRAPEGEIRIPVIAAAATMGGPAGARRFGAVLDLNDEELCLWVPGMTPDSGQWQAPPKNFLGWHCAAGAGFEVTAGAELAISTFHFQPASYRSHELLALHANTGSR